MVLMSVSLILDMVLHVHFEVQQPLVPIRVHEESCPDPGTIAIAPAIIG